MNPDSSHLEREVAVLSEQIRTLLKVSDEVRTDIREIKNTQDNRIIVLERQISVLQEQVSRLDWLYRLVLGLAVSGIIGAIINLIIKN